MGQKWQHSLDCLCCIISLFRNVSAVQKELLSRKPLVHDTKNKMFLSLSVHIKEAVCGKYTLYLRICIYHSAVTLSRFIIQIMIGVR